MTHKLHITVATVIEKNSKFLFVEEKSNGKVVVNQPAGHVEKGESFVDAAKRETYEETGWLTEPVALLSIYRWQNSAKSDTFFRVTFESKLIRHDENSKLDAGILRTLWLDKNELQAEYSRLRSPMVSRSIDDYYSPNRYPLELFVDL